MPELSRTPVLRHCDAAYIVQRMTTDELADHRAWLEDHDERPDPDDCAICAEMLAREK